MAIPAKTNQVIVRPAVLWAYSIGINTVLGLILAVQTFYSQRADGSNPDFSQILIRTMISFGIYALLAPPVLWLCWRYPIGRKHLFSRLGLHFVASLLFVAIHTTLRIAVYPIHMLGKVVPVTFGLWRILFLYLVFDNIVNTYAMFAIFGHMLLYYHDLRERQVRAAQLEGKLAKSQLSMLKMQLQPHFLFNTLHTVSALTRDSPEAAEDMLARLSELLRQTLDNDAAQEVPLRAEMDFLGRYLEIEQVRFADRLAVRIDLEADTLDALVPNMVLQPLVENALRHGIGRKAQGGRLEIRSWREEGNCVLCVQDSGPGFPAVGTIAEGIGLSNTRSRLEHLHPGQHELRFEVAPGGGALVTLRIPFRTIGIEEAPSDEAIHI